MKKPLVSVVIPVYNEEKYLAFCLSSLIDQTYVNTEIIIVNDGSTDTSAAIALRFQSQYPKSKLKLFTQLHQGSGMARNFGVTHANGEIIVFPDADMRYDRRYLEKLLQPILAGKVIGTFNKEEYVANPENIWSRCWSFNSGLPFNRRLPEDYHNEENAFRAILKKCFLNGGGYEINEGYTDDSSLSYKIKKGAVNASGAISYHFNPSSLSEVFYSARWIGRSKLFKPNVINFLRYSPFNSLRVGTKYVLLGAPFQIIFFKLIYDFGMFYGIFFRYGKTAK